MGKFALQMMGAVGELERNTSVDNVKMGHKQRARTGKHNGKVPLGYRSIKVDERGRETRIVVVEEEAALVRNIFEQHAASHGLKAIANDLNHRGHKPRLASLPPLAPSGTFSTIRCLQGKSATIATKTGRRDGAKESPQRSYWLKVIIRRSFLKSYGRRYSSPTAEE